ncbi:hypothetical protein PIB30_031833 [Stylosanthes scabra]|uniref:Uncharacterized protein n=1 Tax=Stylosanthes scabra TaxID=79078 RepID=A0ABU6SBN3_9FABA|nr:hypothetical protein [Stylosanthes scabra]
MRASRDASSNAQAVKTRELNGVAMQEERCGTEQRCPAVATLANKHGKENATARKERRGRYTTVCDDDIKTKGTGSAPATTNTWPAATESEEGLSMRRGCLR